MICNLKPLTTRSILTLTLSMIKALYFSSLSKITDAQDLLSKPSFRTISSPSILISSHRTNLIISNIRTICLSNKGLLSIDLTHLIMLPDRDSANLIQTIVNCNRVSITSQEKVMDINLTQCDLIDLKGMFLLLQHINSSRILLLLFLILCTHQGTSLMKLLTQSSSIQALS